MPDRPEGIWGEIERLRDWRHDDVEPMLAAHDKTLDFLRGRGDALSERLTVVERRVDEMATAAKIADAVADRMHERRGEWLTGWQKAGAALVGLAALGAFALEVYLAATG